MGRVSKYKRSKKFDLFNERGDADQSFDRPPSEFEEKAERVSRKRRRQWAKEALNEEEYIAELDAKSGITPSKAAPKAVDLNIEPKRADESMKSFKQRIRDQTRQVLLQEAKNRSSTAQKRKNFLKEKKQKQKQTKKNAMEGRNDVIEVGRSTQFPTAPAVRFGEVADAPPEFRAVPKKGLKATEHTNLKILGDKLKGSGSGKAAQGAGSGESISQQRQMEALRQRVQEAYAQVRKKRREGEEGQSIVL